MGEIANVAYKDNLSYADFEKIWLKNNQYSGITKKVYDKKRTTKIPNNRNKNLNK